MYARTNVKTQDMMIIHLLGNFSKQVILDKRMDDYAVVYTAFLTSKNSPKSTVFLCRSNKPYTVFGFLPVFELKNELREPFDCS